jgi:hypothetical protein
MPFCWGWRKTPATWWSSPSQSRGVGFLSRSTGTVRRSFERCPDVILVHRTLVPGSGTMACCAGVTVCTTSRRRSSSAASSTAVWLSRVTLTPRCPPESTPWSSATTSFALVRGRSIWTVLVLPLAHSQWRFSKQSDYWGVPLGPVAFVDETTVSDVLPFNALSGLRFLQNLPHVVVVSQLLLPQGGTFGSARIGSSDDSFLPTAHLSLFSHIVALALRCGTGGRDLTPVRSLHCTQPCFQLLVLLFQSCSTGLQSYFLVSKRVNVMEPASLSLRAGFSFSCKCFRQCRVSVTLPGPGRQCLLRWSAFPHCQHADRPSVRLSADGGRIPLGTGHPCHCQPRWCSGCHLRCLQL